MQLDDGIKLVLRFSQLEIPVGKEMVAWVFMQCLGSLAGNSAVEESIFDLVPHPTTSKPTLGSGSLSISPELFVQTRLTMLPKQHH